MSQIKGKRQTHPKGKGRKDFKSTEWKVPGRKEGRSRKLRKEDEAEKASRKKDMVWVEKVTG